MAEPVFLNPVAYEHERQTNAIINAYRKGAISREDAGLLMYAHLQGGDEWKPLQPAG